MSSVFENLQEVSGNGQHAEFAFEPGDFGDQYPGIWELLSRQVFKGKPCKTCTVQIFAQDSLATICVQDRHRLRKGFKSAEGVTEAFQVLEIALWKEDVQWRSDKPKYQR